MPSNFPFLKEILPRFPNKLILKIRASWVILRLTNFIGKSNYIYDIIMKIYYVSYLMTLILCHKFDGFFRCVHYRRKCEIRAPCCGEVFDCRHCHNEAKVRTSHWILWNFARLISSWFIQDTDFWPSGISLISSLQDSLEVSVHDRHVVPRHDIKLVSDRRRSWPAVQSTWNCKRTNLYSH